MALSSNNNQKCIGHLASNSIKCSKMRNIVTILTIALSVSLLTVIGMFTLGQQEIMKKQVAQMQHVIYQETDEEQIKKLTQNEYVEEFLLYKAGKTVTMGDYMFYPMYCEEKETSIKTMKLSEGNAPQKEKEAVVYKEFLETIGKQTKLGETFEVPAMDGSTEEFIVTGFIEGTPFQKNYPFMVSRAYADKGISLKDIHYNTFVRIRGAESMSKQEFKDCIWEIGDGYGIDRTNVNSNGAFEQTLMSADKMMEIQLAAGLGLALLLVSVLVIYSIFYISVVGRIRQFGQLRTIGMTRRQVKKMVSREGLMLGSLGIPIGLGIGGIIAYFLVPDGFSWANTLFLVILIAAAEMITIVVSVRKPAKLASGISPIEATKYTAYAGKVNKGKTRSLHRAITPYSMARMGFARNWKKTVLTLVSLGLGGILFMCGVTYLNSMNQEEYSRQGEFSIGEYVIEFSSSATENAVHKSSELQVDNPLNASLKQEILDIPGVEKVSDPQSTNVEYQFRGEALRENLKSFTKDQVTEIKDVLEEGSIDYDKMLQNSEILIQGNELVEEIFGDKYKIGDTIELTFYNGQEVKKTFTIRGFVDITYKKEEGWPMFWIPEEMLNDIMGSVNMTDRFIVKVDMAKEAEITPVLQQMIESNPKLEIAALSERIESDKAIFTTQYSMVIGLAVFIIAFSTINLVNTLITNILSRKQEFAVLQSLGMSNRQLVKMIQAEGLILALGNVVLTAVLGTGLGYLLISIMQTMDVDYFHYHFPGWYLLGYAVFTVIVPIIVTGVSIKRFRKEAIVDRMREVD